MKNILIKILIVSCLVLSSCDKLEDLNVNKKAFTKVTPESLINYATQRLSIQLFRQSVNTNNFNIWMQYWTETTYTDEANYNIVSRNMSENVYSIIYNRVLANYKKAMEFLDEEITKANLEEDRQNYINQKSIADFLSVVAYENLVNSFGDIPYEQALDPDKTLTPKYTSQKEVYLDLIKRLKTDIDALDTSKKGLVIDNIYGGDVSKWKKFMASFYLRLGVILSDDDSAKAKEIIKEAVDYGVFESNDDNAFHKFISEQPNRNPFYETFVASGRDDYVATENIVDKLTQLNDPRISKFFNSNVTSYKGGVVGNGNSYGKFSHASDDVVGKADRAYLFDGLFRGFFLLAYARSKDYITQGTAEEYYNRGVRSSIDFWGAEDADTYLSANGVKYDASNSKDLIATQMWIALYTRGYSSWLYWRFFDGPNMKEATQAKTENKDVPYRLTYPIVEQTINKTSLDEAINNMGGNTLEIKLFWDKN